MNGKPYIFLAIANMIINISYGNVNVDLALSYVRNLEFKKAHLVIADVNDKENINLLSQYILLFQLNSIQKNGDMKNSTVREGFPSINPLTYLVDGYENLFINDLRAKAYKDFLIGMDLLDANQIELKKAFLLGLFKVINEGYEINIDDFKIHLRSYKKLISDSSDKFWFHYYTIELNDLTTSYKEGEHDNLKFYKSHLDSLNLIRNSLKNKDVLALVNILNGNFYVKYNGKRAFEFYKYAEKRIDSSLFLNPYKFRIKLDKARCYDQMKNTKKAIKDVLEAKKFLNSGNIITNKLNYSFFLSEFYAKMGQIDSSNFYMRKERTLLDESNYINANRRIEDLKIELDTEKKEIQILEEQQRAIRNRNWLIAACLALLFGTGIAVLFQKNTTKKRLLAEQEALLKQERVDNLLKEQELVSIDAMIAGQEKERQRVANELHDDLGSLMATIKLHFDNSKVSKKDPGLQNAQKLLDQAYQKVRSMAHSKNSGVMSDQGLLPAIKKMAQVITETNALEVRVEDFGMGDRLENSLELNLFRMVQELVANTIKHAEASKVSIQLTQHEDNLNIIIEDNGKGFDRSKVDSGKTGMGLTTIEKRVEHLEGNFTVDSVLGKGTSILIDIPV